MPKDIPAHPEWEDGNFAWYMLSPWKAPTSEQLLKMADKEWGPNILDKNRNEFIFKPFHLRSYGEGVMCVIRDRSLSISRRILNCSQAPIAFHYFWDGGPQRCADEIRKLMTPIATDYPRVDLRSGSIEFTFKAWCFEEEDVRLIHSLIKKVADKNGGKTQNNDAEDM